MTKHLESAFRSYTQRNDDASLRGWRSQEPAEIDNAASVGEEEIEDVEYLDGSASDVGELEERCFVPVTNFS